ncbi:MAG: S46 family peptidase [Schleiferiaceae bacterium]
MRKFTAGLLTLAFVLSSVITTAHEGMWLPMLIKRLNMAEMQANGLNLTAEELYDINNASVKDAIVSLGGFCTGELISDQGLMLTNHHCGYDAIRSHSTVENDYLTDGFWAMTREEERTNPGLTAAILVRMEDVTDKVMAELTDEMTEAERAAKAKEVGDALAKEATEGTVHNAYVRSFFHNNEYYLFVFNTYKDVRLVGAPPSSVGKYGGDTDNWMWPRHTGDFSMFRVYADADGNPSDISDSNVPLTPKHHLPVSLNGVEEGDFTMVFGFPGSTDRFLTSTGIEQAINLYNPTVVEIREEKLAIMKEAMDADAAVRIALASNYASTANYWKYFIGQTEQLKKNGVKAKKEAIEERYLAWANGDEARADYAGALDLLNEAYAATDATVKGQVYLMEAGIRGASLPLYAFRLNRMLGALASSEDIEGDKAAVLAYADDHFAEYQADVDRKLAASLWSMWMENVPAEQQPQAFQEVRDSLAGDVSVLVNDIYDNSIYASKEALEAWLETMDAEVLAADKGGQLANSFIMAYFASQNGNKDINEKMEKGYRLFTDGLRQAMPEKTFAPDANSTLRMTWGVVGSYAPKDGVHYNYTTTIEGIMQKEDPSNPEFVVPAKLKELYNAKDYGQYADDNGDLIVNFISNNDITGGNSGSPVINGDGELIGTAFDGNWEAMSGDIFFEDQLQRTISVDIRYTLFIIDKYAGASHLIDEMTVVKGKSKKKKKKNRRK